MSRYLGKKFGQDLPAVRTAMQALAEAYLPEALAERAFSLYEAFRPKIPEGKTGWGGAGSETNLVGCLVCAPFQTYFTGGE